MTEKQELLYTVEDGIRSSRNWQSLPAVIDGDSIIAKGLPADANTWVITVSDERGAMVSSAPGLR